MKRYYIRHKLQIGDIAHLSDEDSERIISNSWHKEEEFIEIECPSGIFLAQITFIAHGSVEIEIVKYLSTSTLNKHDRPQIIILQSLSNDRKFDYFIEKAVELGVGEIIPIESDYSLLSSEKAKRLEKKWEEIIKNATDQSRNAAPTIINEPIKLASISKTLETTYKNYKKICLSTEQVDRKALSSIIKKNENIIIAVGPEKGWSSSDISAFKKLNFEFAILGKNILRTETCGLVVVTIFKYINGEF